MMFIGRSKQIWLVFCWMSISIESKMTEMILKIKSDFDMLFECSLQKTSGLSQQQLYTDAVLKLRMHFERGGGMLSTLPKLK